MARRSPLAFCLQALGCVLISLITKVAYAQTMTLSAPSSSGTCVDNCAVVFSISGETGGINTVQVVMTQTSGFGTPNYGDQYVFTMFSTSATQSFSFNPSTATSSALFSNVSPARNPPDGTYQFQVRYTRTATGAVVRSNTASPVTTDTGALPPILSAPLARTRYKTIPVAYNIPESFFSGSAKLLFTSPNNTITVTGTNGLRNNSYVLVPSGILGPGGTPTAVAGILSTTSNIIPDDTYNVSFSYRDTNNHTSTPINAGLVTIDSLPPAPPVFPFTSIVTNDDTPTLTYFVDEPDISVAFSSNIDGLLSTPTPTFTPTFTVTPTPTTGTAPTFTPTRTPTSTPVGGGPTPVPNTSTPTPTTTATPTVTVTYTPTTRAGFFSYTTTQLSEGTHTIEAVARDLAVNIATPAAITVIIDKTAPAAPTLAPLTSPSNSREQTISYSVAEGGLTVAFTSDIDGVLGSATPSSGANTFTARGLSSNTHTISAVATDAAGNSSTAGTATIAIDTTAPAAPVLTPLSSPTNSNNPVITYSVAETGLSVSFRSSRDGVLGTTSPSSGSNTFSVTSLTDGAHVISAVATDSAGNVSETSSFAVVVDTAIPTPTPTPGATPASVLNFSAPAASTLYVDNLPVAWTISDPAGTPQAGTIKLHLIQTAGSAVGTTKELILPNTSSGSQSFGLITNSIPDGTYSAYLSYKRPNSVGGTILNSLTSTDIRTDSITLAPTVQAPATNGAYSSSIPLQYTLPEAPLASSVNITFDDSVHTPVVLGMDDSATVSTTVNPSSLTAVGNVQSSTSTSLLDGIYEVSISYQDSHSHTAATVTKTTVRIDRVPPTLSLITPVEEVTGDSTPALTFMSSEAGTIAYSGGCSGSTTTASSGNSTISLASTGEGDPLTDGTYANCAIAVTDAAGNISNTLAVPLFKVATILPSVPSIAAFRNPTQSTRPTFIASFDEAGLNVTMSSSIDGRVAEFVSAVGPNSISTSALSEGSHTITVTAKNSVLNTVSTSFGLIVDHTNPVLTLVGVSPVTINQGQIYTDAGATAVDGISGDLTSSITVLNPVDTAALGSYLVKYLAFDPAGNVSIATRTVIVAVAPTPTPLPTLTASPTETPSPGPTVSPTPTVAPTQLRGRILLANGQPAAGILVRLFNSGPTTSSDSTSSDLDGLSTVTDEFGNYSFENLSTGTYRVDPDLIGFNFEPAEVTLDAGIPSPDIEAIPIPGPTDQCTRVNKSAVIAEADTNARALSDIGLQLSTDYMAIAKNRLDAPHRSYYVKSLRSAVVKVRRSLQNLLAQSQTLPTVKFVCPKEASCTKKRYAQAVGKYRLNVTNIRKLDFFILRTAKEFFAKSVGPNRRVAAKRVLTIHRRAIAAVKSFPLDSFDCEQ